VSSTDSPLAGVAVDASDPVVLVCVPPLLPTVTPGATSVLEDVEPDVVVVPVAVVSVPVDVDPPLVDVESPVVAGDEVADSVDDSPVDVELVEDDSEDVPVVSALATPGEVATITPIPRAAANAPTRPMYPPSFAALWAALRDGVGLVGALDECEANRGLAGGWLSVMGSTPMAFRWREGLILIDRSNDKVAHVYHDPKYPVNPVAVGTVNGNAAKG
jgi:hypothetical protein